LYPPALHPDETSFRDELERIGAVDPRVRVAVGRYEDGSARRTRRSSPTFVRTDEDRDDLTREQAELFADIDVALTLDLPFDIGTVAPRLRWVQAVGAGVGQLLSAGLAEHQIRLTNASGTAAPEIAEFVIARILEHWKRLPAIGALQVERRWAPLYGRPLAGCTIGLVGLGPINLSVARLAGAFGMRVLATRRSGVDEPGIDRMYSSAQLTEMVRHCEVVVSALPETAETMGCFDQAFFAAMRPGAYFCNVGRGSAVVDEALVEALRSGHLSGAALDVFHAEPLTQQDPSWSAPGMRVSAHCSSVPAAAIARVHEVFRENLRRHLNGEDLVNEVDVSRGY